MKRIIVSVSLVFMLLSGCSSIKVMPEQIPGGVINQTDNSQTATFNGIELTAGFDEAGINSYNLDSTVSSFKIVIKNATDRDYAFNDESFLLVDDNGLQYSLLTPEQVRTMLKNDSYYLVPFPYVGFYYLDDYEKANAYNKLNSNLPYFYNLYPQDIFTKALSPSTVLPGMKVEGLTYFKIDPSVHKAVKLLVFRKGASKSAPADFTIPFKILK